MTRLRLDQLPPAVQRAIGAGAAEVSTTGKVRRRRETHEVGLPVTCRRCDLTIDHPSESALKIHAERVHPGKAVRFEWRPQTPNTPDQ